VSFDACVVYDSIFGTYHDSIWQPDIEVVVPSGVLKFVLGNDYDVV
jgi:hypothetical protein